MTRADRQGKEKLSEQRFRAGLANSMQYEIIM